LLFTPAVEAALQARNAPVITALDFHLLVGALFVDQQWRGEPLQRLPRAWDQRRSATMISRLIRRGVLTSDRDAGYGVYRVLDVEGQGTTEEVACLVDPSCYVAYASALHLHGLIATRPTPLQLATPAGPQWRSARKARLQRLQMDGQDLPQQYARIHLGEKLRRRSIVVHETVTPAATETKGWIRVSTLAATFADTLIESGRCGGMAAVLKTWDRHARGHVPEIVAALADASKIVKVRAGHILTERLGVETPEILAWQAYAQRGGSRRLDPERPYAPTFSERWMLSLNVEAA
jgi:predicted transcriptional regulator of viral defense system